MHVFLQATMLFAELTYTLATEEAERIGVDHVARMTATGTGENSTGKVSFCVKRWKTVNFLSHMYYVFDLLTSATPFCMKISFLIECNHICETREYYNIFLNS